MPAPTSTTPIDVVNARDESVGTIERGEALARGANFRTAHVFLFASSGKLVLQQLSSTRERHPLRWGSSVAAYLNSGESYEEAASRRLFEELGLQLPLLAIGKIEMLDERSHKFVSLFTAHNGAAAIREPDHIETLAYWPLDRLDEAIETDPQRFTPTFRALFRALRDRLL